MVGQENKKRIDWPLARVKEVIIGKDGDARVVRLTTAHGQLTRPNQKIYPPEIKYDDIEVKHNTGIENKGAIVADEGHSKRVNDNVESDTVEKVIVSKYERISRKPVGYNCS